MQNTATCLQQAILSGDMLQLYSSISALGIYHSAMFLCGIMVLIVSLRIRALQGAENEDKSDREVT